MNLAPATVSLSGNYSAGWAILGGLIGGIAFLLVVYMGLMVGITRMNFLYILGTMVTPGVSAGRAYLIGFMMHEMLAAGFGLAHAGILTAVDPSSVGAAAAWDLLIGAIHGVTILVAMPMMLTVMHPLVRNGRIERPGPAMIGFGPMTPMGSLAAHALFGLVAGAVYAAGVL